MASRVIKPQPGPQEMALASPADILIFGGGAGGGKALALDTPVPTPSGWATMGELRAGDEVFDERGQPCRVTDAWPVINDSAPYRIEFDDGEEIVASSDHLWVTFDYRELVALGKRTDKARASRRAGRASRVSGRKSERFTRALIARNRASPPPTLAPPTGSVRTTREIAEALLCRGARRNQAIAVAGALDLPEANLPLDPYLLGCWLGDGSKSTGIMAAHDDDAPEIIGAFAVAGFETKKYAAQYTWAIHGLMKVIRSLGLFNNKHVPAPYLRASSAQRLALLQGLMDTDGSASSDGKVSFGTTSPALRDAAAELARSLGWKVGVSERRAMLYGKDCGPAWNVRWSPTDYVFRLKRKRGRQRVGIRRRSTRFRYVVACDPVESVPVRCIAVNSPSRMYLAGRGMVPTHNSFSLLMEPLRHVQHRGFSAVIFRRTYPELTNLGGLWPESKLLYGDLQYDGREPEPKETTLEWVFPSGSKVKFAHMQHEEDRFSWKGAQVPLVQFDQLEGFTEEQFWYMLSRNRDPSGTCRPYVRASANPVPDDDPIGGWLRRLVAWWIDDETGLSIEGRSGVLRWFVRVGGDLEWADSREEMLARRPDTPPKSMTFVRGLLSDNKILMEADPQYLANLMALSLVERERLLGGNWNVRPEAGKVFNRSWFKIVSAAPARARRVRYWDKASADESEDGAFSAGVLMSEYERTYTVEDVVHGKWSSRERNKVIVQTAALDGPDVEIWLEQEPGSGGKESASISIEQLAGYNVHVERVTGDKVSRARPFSAQAEAGNVRLVSAGWNAKYIGELHAFPDGKFKDQVDASTGAFNKLARGAGGVSISVAGAPSSVAAPRRRVTLTA